MDKTSCSVTWFKSRVDSHRCIVFVAHCEKSMCWSVLFIEVEGHWRKDANRDARI